MGKTKTATIGDEPEKSKKAKDKHEVRVPGLGGGQRVVAMDADPIVNTQETEVEKAEKKAKKAKVRGKKYTEAKARIDNSKDHKVPEAVALLKEVYFAKFVGTVEFHATVRKVGMAVNVSLPHSGGKAKKVEVADDKTIEKLESGKVDFDILLATPEMMPKLVKFARILGPRGLMPNPKNGTVIKSADDAKRFDTSKMTVKTEKKAPLVHVSVGRTDQSDKELIENIEALVAAIGPKQILKAYISASMSPSIKLKVTE